MKSQPVSLDREFARRLYRQLPHVERQYRNPYIPHLPGAGLLPVNPHLFELKTNLEPGGTADAWLVTAAGTADESEVISVKDFLGNLRARGRDDFSSGSFHGAYGWLLPGKDPREILCLQIQAVECRALAAAAVADSDATFEVDHVTPLDDGQSPVDNDGDTLTVTNWARWTAAAGDPLHIVADGAGGWRWVTPEAMAIRWAQISGPPSGGNTNGSSPRTVYGLECRADGSDPGGSSIALTTPIRAARDTSLFANDVVGWIWSGSARLIVTDCWDDPIGTIRAINVASTPIRNGWRELTAARDRVLKGILVGDEDLAETGGTKTHTHANHTVTHDESCVDSGDQLNVVAWRNVGVAAHNTVNHQNPWYGVTWIERFE